MVDSTSMHINRKQVKQVAHQASARSSNQAIKFKSSASSNVKHHQSKTSSTARYRYMIRIARGIYTYIRARRRYEYHRHIMPYRVRYITQAKRFVSIMMIRELFVCKLCTSCSFLLADSSSLLLCCCCYGCCGGSFAVRVVPTAAASDVLYSHCCCLSVRVRAAPQSCRMAVISTAAELLVEKCKASSTPVCLPAAIKPACYH